MTDFLFFFSIFVYFLYTFIFVYDKFSFLKKLIPSFPKFYFVNNINICITLKSINLSEFHIKLFKDYAKLNVAFFN